MNYWGDESSKDEEEEDMRIYVIVGVGELRDFGAKLTMVWGVSGTEI